MKLSEALSILRAEPEPAPDSPRLALVCGFTPLHLETFLAAHIARRRRVPALSTGLFGDVLGTLGGLDPDNVGSVAVVLEWSDLDARLGYRGSHGWRPDLGPDILATTATRIELLDTQLRRVAASAPTVLTLPTIPLPPCFSPSPTVAAPEALALRRQIAEWAADLAATTQVLVLNSECLDGRSLPSKRLRLDTYLAAGFPYTVEHADVLAELLADLLYPAAPLRGVITDLDDTLWHGILGEDGISNLSWSLDDGTHGHALYQELLASLHDTGVLVGLVSKNDPALVTRALSEREDLVVSPACFFPIEAGWGPKSAAVAKVLAAWNIGPDAVAFIDDSPMECEEVARAFPGMHCLQYPSSAEGLLTLLTTLRTLFGKNQVTEEDRLRADSLRLSGEVFRAPEASLETLLAEAESQLTFEIDAPDERVFELVNKTNQFNLNGRRFDRADWTTLLQPEGGFLLSVSYQDKFGPLGKIAALHCRKTDDGAVVDVWVMSCRAFSRRIEHQTLAWIFEFCGAERLHLDLGPTERNGPFQEFVGQFATTDNSGLPCIERRAFLESCPNLYAKVLSP